MARKAKDVKVAVQGKRHQPGSTVVGTVEAAGDDRLEAVLAYADWTGPYTDWIVHDSAVLDAGESFELRLPPNAHPSYESDLCRLGWAVIAGSDVKPGGRRLAFEPIEVAGVKGIDQQMPSALSEGDRFGNRTPAVRVTGPHPGARRWEKSGGFFKKMSVNQQWDAPFAIDRGTVNRGDSVTVTISLEEPKEGRHPIEAGVRCTQHCLGKAGGDIDSERKSMTVVSETVYEDWIGFDPSVADHEIELKIPPSAPFSYSGKVVYYEWKVGVVRPREGDPATKGPPERWLPLWVYP